MTNMPTYPRITQPLAHAPKPDVTTHEDIDWRTVSVAEAIDAERQRVMDQRVKLASLGRKCGKSGMFAVRKPSKWNTLLQVLGIRRMS